MASKTTASKTPSETESGDSSSDLEFPERCDTSDNELFTGVNPAQTTLNLTKCMIGEGMLSLASGLGAETGLAVGIIITVVWAAIMAYTFSLLGRVCHATGCKNLSGCCENLHQPRLGKVMASSILVLTFAACVSFSILLGDNVSEILKSCGATGIWASYHFALVAIIVIVELPLCLIRDMTKLAYTSFVGVTFEICVIIFMAIRFFDNSYRPGGEYYADVTKKNIPDFGEGVSNTLFKIGPNTAKLVSVLALAYIAHFQAPKFYHQLRDRSVPRFNAVTATSFGLASVVFGCSLTFGYLTFGIHSPGNILQGYSTHDHLATSARAGMTVAVGFGFPIIFTGLRDSTLEAFGLSGHRRRIWFSITAVLLFPSTVIACLVRDLGTVNGLVGAILGALTTIVFPAVLCHLAFKEHGTKFCSRVEGIVAPPLLLLIGGALLVGGTASVLS